MKIDFIFEVIISESKNCEISTIEQGNEMAKLINEYLNYHENESNIRVYYRGCNYVSENQTLNEIN